MTKPLRSYGHGDHEEERIPMAINSVNDYLTHIGLADKPPTHISVVEMSHIREWITSSWNHGRMAGYKEAYNAIKEQSIQATVDEATTEAEQFKIRCAAAFKAAKRPKRDGH